MTQAVHQFVHTLSYGDAISGEVLALQRCLRGMGYESEIYCIHVHPRYEDQAHKYAKFVERYGYEFSGGVVLHYSLGSPLNELYLALRKANRALVYHNLTPAAWFYGINPRIVEDLEQGMRELPILCTASNQLIADSTFNAGELEKLGFSATVLELPVDPQRWQEPANQGIANILKSEPGPHILHVGRLAPNKCVEDIIKSFYFLHDHITRDARLWLVGIDIDTEIYSFSLKRLAFELNLDDAVRFVGQRDDSEVRAFYENCHAYLCMSEHEGFCLPVVEAMNFGLPVVALDSSALSDTVGSGGVLVSEKRHAEIGELLHEICTNSELRERVRQAGFERVKQLNFERFEGQVQQLFAAPSSAMGAMRQVAV